MGGCGDWNHHRVDSVRGHMNKEWEDVTFHKSRGGGVAVLNKAWPKRMGLSLGLLQTSERDNLQVLYNQVKFTCTNGEAIYNILDYVDGALDLELAEGFVE